MHFQFVLLVISHLISLEPPVANNKLLLPENLESCDDMASTWQLATLLKIDKGKTAPDLVCCELGT